MEQARKWAMEKLHGLKPIVLGLAHPKRECWVLAGYEAKNQDEHELLDTVRRELGFHPCTGADQLTATHGGDKRSAKRILAYLTKDDPIREAECWNAAPLMLLHERGKCTGLADYLRELKSFLIPLFDPAALAKV